MVTEVNLTHGMRIKNKIYVYTVPENLLLKYILRIL